MTDYRLVLKPAKGALILCALGMGLALAMVMGLANYHKGRAAALAQGEGVLQGARSEVQTLADDLAALETQLTRFKHLARIGLVGDPEREVWVRKLEAIHKALDLPPTLRYTLAPPRLLADDPESAALPPSPTMALRHDLDIELSGIHEAEFLTFLDRLRTDWQTPFRIESCQIRRESATGLQIKCTLWLLSLPLAPGG